MVAKKTMIARAAVTLKDEVGAAKAGDFTGKRQKPAIIADKNKYKKGGHKREVSFCPIYRPSYRETRPCSISYEHFYRILQPAGNYFDTAADKKTKYDQKNSNGERSDDDTVNAK